jgi:hypothetical protein
VKRTVIQKKVWPWIVQIGIGRAGFYSYDLLDNLGRASATRILPEWQHPQVGDLAAPMSPFTKSPTEKNAFRVAGIKANRRLLWQQPLSTWMWALEPVGEHQTRLVTRIRARYDWSDPFAVVWLLLMELGDFPMMRKQVRRSGLPVGESTSGGTRSAAEKGPAAMMQLLGIKHRAETNSMDRPRQ